MAGGKGNMLSKWVLDNVLGNASFAANLYLALFTSLMNQTGAGAQEVTGSGYSRLAITNNATSWPAASGSLAGQKSNGITLTFNDALGDWGTVTSWQLFSGASTPVQSGLWYGEFLGPYLPFTVNPANNQFTSSGHGLSNSLPVRVRNDNGQLPSGLNSGTQYFVISGATDTFCLSTSNGGPVNVIGTAGNGTNSVALDYFKSYSIYDTANIRPNNLVINED